MRVIACGASVAGPRHLNLSESNQDAMSLVGCRGGWIATVADGLGSRIHSAVGAHRACQVARHILRTMPNNCALPTIPPLIHEQWLDAIIPITAQDAATTLLFAQVMAQGEIRAAQLGDGLLLLKCAGQIHHITPERIGYGNQTRSLESAHCQDKWQTVVGKITQPGDGVVLMTDGIADDLKPDQLAEFCDVLYQNLSKRNRRRGRCWLQCELNDWATPLHSDDKTLVAIFGTTK